MAKTARINKDESVIKKQDSIKEYQEEYHQLTWEDFGYVLKGYR